MGSEAILRDICTGLTGDRMKDAAYLLRQAMRCKEAGCGESVINEIGRMIFSLIPCVDEGSLT